MTKRFLSVTLATASLLLVPGLLAQPMGEPTAADLPPDAKVGECYARVFVPAQFVTEGEQVLIKSASERLEIVPAQYETVSEQVMVKPATTRLVEVPAVYDWEDEVVEVSPARTEWKKGPCDMRHVANATGECLCLVEIPAVFKTVKRKVMTQPPTTREVVIPAEYHTVTRTVEVRPAAEQRIPIAAEYTTVSRQVKVSDARMTWQIIDCKYGGPVFDHDTAMRLQRALKDKGHDPGPVDGIYGPLTRGALQQFQDANGLPHEGLGSRTREALGLPAAD